MQLNLENSDAKYQIKSYTTGSILINSETFNSPIIITPDYLAPWQVGDLQSILELAPAIVIFGTGALRTELELDPNLSTIFQQQKIGIEVMTTAAACRTYTILAAERRRVVAALIV